MYIFITPLLKSGSYREIQHKRQIWSERCTCTETALAYKPYLYCIHPSCFRSMVPKRYLHPEPWKRIFADLPILWPSKHF